MPKSLVRLVALILVPCLVADPAFAQFASISLALRSILTSPQLSILQTQALAAPPTSGHKVLARQPLLGGVVLSYNVKNPPQPTFAPFSPISAAIMASITGWLAYKYIVH